MDSEFDYDRMVSVRRSVLMEMEDRIKELEEQNANNVGIYSEQVARLRSCLKRLEWCDDRWVDNPGDQPLCPACAEPKMRGHAPDCWLAAAIKEEE